MSQKRISECTLSRVAGAADVDVATKRWNDPVDPDDGKRILICRYRPRGVKREGEPWDVWVPELAPSPALHAAAYGKEQAPIPWDVYRHRYLEEMEASRFWWKSYAEAIARGERLTLLCSSACVDPARCHRTLLRELLLQAARPEPPAEPRPTVRRR